MNMRNTEPNRPFGI